MLAILLWACTADGAPSLNSIGRMFGHASMSRAPPAMAGAQRAFDVEVADPSERRLADDIRASMPDEPKQRRSKTVLGAKTMLGLKLGAIEEVYPSP